MNFPLHPALVHFPIAFLYGALILHAIQLWRPHWMCRIIGLWLLGMSAVISIATPIAGGREMISAGPKAYSTETIAVSYTPLMLLTRRLVKLVSVC